MVALCTFTLSRALCILNFSLVQEVWWPCVPFTLSKRCGHVYSTWRKFLWKGVGLARSARWGKWGSMEGGGAGSLSKVGKWGPMEGGGARSARWGKWGPMEGGGAGSLSKVGVLWKGVGLAQQGGGNGVLWKGVGLAQQGGGNGVLWKGVGLSQQGWGKWGPVEGGGARLARLGEIGSCGRGWGWLAQQGGGKWCLMEGGGAGQVI